MKALRAIEAMTGQAFGYKGWSPMPAFFYPGLASRTQGIHEMEISCHYHNNRHSIVLIAFLVLPGEPSPVSIGLHLETSYMMLN